MSIADKTQKMAGKFELSTSSPISEEKENPQHLDLTGKDGATEAQYVKKDGKVLSQAASVDAQSSGEHEKAAKKAGARKDEVQYTSASMAAAKGAVDSKDQLKQTHGQKAKLLLAQAKSKKPKGKPSEGKVDSSMSKMASLKTGESESKMEKSGEAPLLPNPPSKVHAFIANFKAKKEKDKQSGPNPTMSQTVVGIGKERGQVPPAPSHPRPMQKAAPEGEKAKSPWAMCTAVLKKAQACYSKPAPMEKSSDGVMQELRHVMKKISGKK